MLFSILSAFFTVAFTVFLSRDYFRSYAFGSAPFYVYVLVRAIEFLLPAVICLIGGIVIRKRRGRP